MSLQDDLDTTEIKDEAQQQPFDTDEPLKQKPKESITRLNGDIRVHRNIEFSAPRRKELIKRTVELLQQIQLKRLEG